MRKSSFAAVPVLAALILSMAPSSALAVERPTTFELHMGSSCIGGQTSDAATVNVDWKGAGGAVKLDAALLADAAGNWLVCADPSRVLAIGDEIEAVVGLTTHSLTVPNLTLMIDRVADRYFGRGPAGDVVTLRFDRHLWEGLRGRKDKTVKPDGTWTYQGTHDVVGGLYASLLWTSPELDTVLIEALAPNITLNLDDSRFQGVAPPKSTLTAKLLDSGTSALIGKKKVSVDRLGSFVGRFRDSGGDAVPVSVGDHFQAPKLASDADWVVPQITGEVHPDVDVIGLTCHDAGTSARTVMIRVITPDGTTILETTGGTEDNGTTAIRFLAGFDVGDTVVISCMQVTGDWVQRSIVAE